MPIRGKTEFMSCLSAALKTKAGGSLTPRGKAAIHFNIKTKRNLLLLMKEISSVRRKVHLFLLGEEEGGRWSPSGKYITKFIILQIKRFRQAVCYNNGAFFLFVNKNGRAKPTNVKKRYVLFINPAPVRLYCRKRKGILEYTYI